MPIVKVEISGPAKSKLETVAKLNKRSLRAHIAYLVEQSVEGLGIEESLERVGLVVIGKTDKGQDIYDPVTPQQMREFQNLIFDCQEKRKRGEEVLQPVLAGYKPIS